MSDVLKNPVVGTVFELEIDGITVAAFEEIDVPDLRRPVIGNRTGVDPSHQTLTLGNYEPVEITLRKVVRQMDSIALNQFIEWRDQGGQMKKSGSITWKHPETLVAYARLTFENAVCNSLKLPNVNANEPTAKSMFEIKFTVPRYYEIAL